MSPVAAVVGDGANLQRGATETQASAGRIAGSRASLEPTPRPNQTSGLSGTGGTGTSRTCSGSLADRQRRHRRDLLEKARSRRDSQPFATSIEQLAVTGALTQPGPQMPSQPIHERRGNLPRRSGNTNELTSDRLETQAPSKTARLKVTPVVSPCHVESCDPALHNLFENGGENMCKLHPSSLDH